MSARLCYRRADGGTDFCHANVRSTTLRHSPKPLPCAVRRIVNNDRMPPFRKLPPNRNRGPRLLDLADAAAVHMMVVGVLEAAITYGLGVAFASR
jgi:hypothetical protein